MEPPLRLGNVPRRVGSERCLTWGPGGMVLVNSGHSALAPPDHAMPLFVLGRPLLIFLAAHAALIALAVLLAG
jgi:hypothetical protein